MHRARWFSAGATASSHSTENLLPENTSWILAEKHMRVLLCMAQSAIIFVSTSLSFALPPIVFVTQPPHPSDFATINATFGNQQATLYSVPRGGDLYIRYPSGNLKNITAAAGYGNSGFQGAQAIAVRDPAVDWSGQRIIFSMVTGAPTQRYQVQSYRWQLYEVSGLGESETPLITKVPNQPNQYNNIMPVYGSDDRIIFVSDRPRAGLTHTYPQRDEYESTPTNTGIWSLEPRNGELFQIDHSPSGDFNPLIDSFGRIIFVRWDHLQRDQQNRCSQAHWGAFNYRDETPTAAPLNHDTEVFPEPRAACEQPSGTTLDRHTFNHFLPWQVNQDGTGLETVNHIGRHELAGYIGRSFNDDSNIVEFYGQYARLNQAPLDNVFQLQEDPNQAGTYLGVQAPEFGTHASGQIISFSAPPDKTADQVLVKYLTHPDTSRTDANPSDAHIGLSRDPLRLSDGTLIAAHSGSTVADSNIGSNTSPQSRYAYRLRQYPSAGTYHTPDSFLTSGITKSISFWNPDALVSYNSVTLWELQPREIRARIRPTTTTLHIEIPEATIFEEAAVNVDELRAYLQEQNLALIIGRNVTSRDRLDKQQPFNLKIAGSDTQTIGATGRMYPVSLLQIFQGDLIRAYSGSSSTQNGRRILAQPLHSVSINPPITSPIQGAVELGSDGSFAAFVPARQALTYQLTDGEGRGVVRERLWLTFQPGEIRVCASCHGVNSKDQAGRGVPQNPPQALATLLDHWKGVPREQPEIRLTAISQKVKGSRSKGLRARLKFTLQGKNSAAQAKQIALHATIAGKSCGPLISVTTDEAGNHTASTRPFNLPSKRTKIEISVLLGSRILDNRSVTLTAAPRGGAAQTRLCAILKRSM